MTNMKILYLKTNHDNKKTKHLTTKFQDIMKILNHTSPTYQQQKNLDQNSINIIKRNRTTNTKGIKASIIRNKQVQRP